ncbi:MAG: P1 family peptidase [Chloroflexota bacterium]
MSKGALTDIAGLKVGHWTDLQGGTGCTVILCEDGALAAVDVRGGAPATRETDLLKPGNLVEKVHAILLSGGSAFGLNAAAGVMRFLDERGVGFPTAGGPVPIVSGASLFDLAFGRRTWPDPDAGYAACHAAGTYIQEGCVGAGTGATVAKMGGPGGAYKSGIGTASTSLPDGTVIAALIAVNALGSIYEPQSGAAVAVPRTQIGGPNASTMNTTIGVIATNARLDRGGAARLATVGHDGLALAIRPAHTLYDGDTLFALCVPAAATGPTHPLLLDNAVSAVVAEAVLRAVRTATPMFGLPAVST